MAKIKRNTLIFTKQNFQYFLKMYADTIIEHGAEKAKDMMFDTMLGDELFINMIFCVALSKMNEIIDKSGNTIQDFSNI
jgi:hypothetical protein